jgi:AraC-like DNA-binding protein
VPVWTATRATSSCSPERARRELIDSGERLSISELAARYRFADGSHFSRLFKKQYGHPPGRWTRLDDEPTMPP